MAADPPVQISCVVEGILDEAVLARLIAEAGAVPGPVYGGRGKSPIRRGLAGFNQAALRSPWVVLVDLNQSWECAPLLKNDWLPHVAPFMCFRVAVREIEAWLLADGEGLAKFLSVPKSRFPASPETLADPKQALLNLAGQSRRSAVRRDVVPRPGSGRQVGALYNALLTEFASNSWQPNVAVHRSDSLRRCIKCLGSLTRRWRERMTSRT